jgi:predicted nucleotidyltransferase
VVETTIDLKSVIERYSEMLQSMGIRCERILLFGSQATGKASEDSDIDLLVISADWSPYSERERLEMLGIAAARILEPIQAWGITPEEIAMRRLTPFQEHILNEQAIAV